MILRPVRPVSPCGPPMTKRPVGLMWKMVRSSINSAGMTGRMTFSITASRRSRLLTFGECWVEMTMALARTGRLPSYSIDTCDLPSGRRKSSSFDLRTSVSRRTSLCAIMIGSGISSGVSAHGEAEHQTLVSRAAGVNALGRCRADCGSIDEMTAQVSLSEAVFGARVTDLPDRVAHDGGKVDVGFGGDLARDHGQAGGDERFTRDAADRILCQNCIQDRVRDLIGDLVRMSLGDGLRSEKGPVIRHDGSAP